MKKIILFSILALLLNGCMYTHYSRNNNTGLLYEGITSKTCPKRKYVGITLYCYDKYGNFIFRQKPESESSASYLYKNGLSF